MTMTRSRTRQSAAALGAALWASCAVAADTPGALPGDDGLTCEQIYAQASAESQRDQQQRANKNEERRKQGQATAALIGGAMMVGGLGGTGQAAQKAADAQVAQSVTLLGAPPSNLRMDHLKQLWARKQCARK
jgi:hypothetical protein